MISGTKKPKPIVVVRDDREKLPWDTRLLGPGFVFETGRLKTADYTLKGMEDIVCIEKKENWEELIGNLSRPVNRVNFIKQLRRMRKYPIRMLVIHDEVSRIPFARSYTNSFNNMALYHWVIDLPLQYNIPVLAIGPRTRSQYPLAQLIRRIYEGNKDGTLHYHT